MFQNPDLKARSRFPRYYLDDYGCGVLIQSERLQMPSALLAKRFQSLFAPYSKFTIALKGPFGLPTKTGFSRLQARNLLTVLKPELVSITGSKEPSGIAYIAPIAEKPKFGGRKPRPGQDQRRRRPR